MWRVYESPRTRKSIKKLPAEILRKYEIWKAVVGTSGPQGLREVRGFRDEALQGKLFGFRSSRINVQYRVIYKVKKESVLVEVIDINAHRY